MAKAKKAKPATSEVVHIGNLNERMSEDARAAFDAWCKGKTASAVAAMSSELDAAGLENRNGRIFLDTVKRVCT